MKFNEAGWAFACDGKTHEISDNDISDLPCLAEQEDQWARNVKAEAEYYNAHPPTGAELLIHQLRVMNTGGAMVHYPFGYICTFPSRRHLFRGENQDFPYSESSLGRRCRYQKGDQRGKLRSAKEQEILHVISNMRIH